MLGEGFLLLETKYLEILFLTNWETFRGRAYFPGRESFSYPQNVNLNTVLSSNWAKSFHTNKIMRWKFPFFGIFFFGVTFEYYGKE